MLRLVPLLVSAAVGLAGGIGSYTFVFAKGSSYFGHDPSACANCHVMTDHYDAWVKSSHRAVAGCNDCHTPPSLVPKYLTKASNGFWHSFAFTTDRFHEPIRIKPRNHDVTEKACQHCHQDIVDNVNAGYQHGETRSCIQCHGQVGHAL